MAALHGPFLRLLLSLSSIFTREGDGTFSLPPGTTTGSSCPRAMVNLIRRNHEMKD